MRERKCDDAGFISEERLRERLSLEMKELLIELRSLLDSGLSKNSEFHGSSIWNFIELFLKYL